jgi:hypothetical protein
MPARIDVPCSINRFSDDTPPAVPGRAGDADVHRVLLP